MKVRALLCAIFGHQPHEYNRQDGRREIEYTECARCYARKDRQNPGWIHKDDDE